MGGDKNALKGGSTRMLLSPYEYLLNYCSDFANVYFLKETTKLEQMRLKEGGIKQYQVPISQFVDV